ncbi:SIMPL domain-containing protein [Fodinibius sp.]|uniref:SIMPL domain-containing protein n=1 Tax=Fodinibius sp. TaxID=1872440 RepID=UPI0035644CB9
MRIFSLFLALFLFTGGAIQAQENIISINSSASVEIPADRIAFHINLNGEAATPREAFDLHKEREEVLLELLKKHQIEEDDINIEPIAISRTNVHREDQEPRIRTRQNVTLTLSDFDRYEEIQIALIESGYDEFNGNFVSSEAESGKDEALKEALKTAREKGELIAKESTLKLDGIQSIDFSYNQSPPRPLMEMAAFQQDRSKSSLISEYGQSVSVSASVSVKYNFSPLEN